MSVFFYGGSKKNNSYLIQKKFEDSDQGEALVVWSKAEPWTQKKKQALGKLPALAPGPYFLLVNDVGSPLYDAFADEKYLFGRSN